MNAIKSIKWKIFWSFAALFVSYESYSQQKATEFGIIISHPNEAKIVVDPQENLICINQSNKQFEVDFLDSEFNVVHKNTIDIIKSDKNAEMLGAIATEQECYIYTYNKKLNALSCLTVKKTSNESQFSRIKIINTNDQLLSAFEMGGNFYFLIVTKHTNKLQVLKLNGVEATEINYQVELPNFYAFISKNSDQVNTKSYSDINIQDISYKGNNHLQKTYSTKKLYHFNESIILTFDEPGLTHMLTLYPNEQKSDYKKLNFELDKGNSSNQKQGNSFIYQNSLLRTTYSPDQLNLSILNLDSMKLVNTYNFYPDEPINILNGPIVEKSGISNNDEMVLKNTNQYFKRISRGNLAVAAHSVDSSLVEIELGAFEQYYINRPGSSSFGMPVGIGLGMGGIGMGMGGIGIGTGGMGMGMGYPGGFGGPGYYSSQPNARIKTTYFSSILNNEDYSHKAGYNTTKDMDEKINDYENNVFRSNYPDVLTSSSTSQSTYLGYYRKNGKKFIIVEFKKN